MGENINYYHLEILGSHHSGVFNYSMTLGMENDPQDCVFNIEKSQNYYIVKNIVDIVENSINQLLKNIQTVNYNFLVNKVQKFYDLENLRINSNRLLTKFKYEY